MRVLLLPLLGMLYILGGCGPRVIVVFDHPPHYPEAGEIYYVDDHATIAEIDAVNTLSFPDDRASHLLRIARRPNLGDDAQKHLVVTAIQKLSFPDDRTGVLSTLARNPTLRPAGRKAILDHLSRLSFPDDRADVLAQLSANPGIAVPASPPASPAPAKVGTDNLP